jgi:hypothetical protein
LFGFEFAATNDGSTIAIVCEHAAMSEGLLGVTRQGA